MMDSVTQVRERASAARSQWLAAVASALDEASVIAADLGSRWTESDEGRLLTLHIRSVRSEIEAMRTATPADRPARWWL